MLQRIAGSRDIRALRTLADVVEPVKDYHREELATTAPAQATPLNRLVDAARPESESARLFSLLVDNFVAGNCKDDRAHAQIRNFLASWQKNDSTLEPAASNSFLLREAAPISRNLAVVAGIGLEALDHIGGPERPPDQWISEQNALLQAASKPTSAQLLLPMAPPIEKLVAASAGSCSPK